MFPVGEADVIVWSWDYSGGSIIQLEQEDSIVVLAEENRAEAASAGQVEPISVVAVIEQSTYTATATVLDNERLEYILRTVGWPGSSIPEALRVIECESRGKPTAIGDNGQSVGLFQLGVARPGWQGWFHYFGLTEGGWEDPMYNARVALMVYNYDIDRGNPPWTQWSCKP